MASAKMRQPHFSETECQSNWNKGTLPRGRESEYASILKGKKIKNQNSAERHQKGAIKEKQTDKRGGYNFFYKPGHEDLAAK